MSSFIFLAPSTESFNKQPHTPIILFSWLEDAKRGKKDVGKRADMFDSVDFRHILSLLDKGLVTSGKQGREVQLFGVSKNLCTLFKAHTTTTSPFF